MRSMEARLEAAKSRFGLGTRVNKDSSSLCHQCQFIFDHWYDRDAWAANWPEHSHHHIVGLQESSQNGCSVCALLLNGLSKSAVNTLTQDWPYLKSLASVHTNSLATNLYRIDLVFQFDELGSKNKFKTSLDAFPSVNNATTIIGTIQEAADADQNWELIQKWLKICRTKHPRCIQNFPVDRQLPTRLIEVGENDKDLKVRITNGLPLQTKYLTLSHCWGGKVFTTLTRSNFQQFQSHIPLDSLSKTFREAIATTRRLGYSYVWIDSLCIIQGDEVDWRRESSKMWSVYANSTLNIAASAAPHGDVGCFTNRMLDRSYCCKVVTAERRTDDLLRTESKYWDITVRNFTLGLTTNVLNSRAWVYQELFLAPRTLHFTPQQLLWECASARACENFPDSFDSLTLTFPRIKTRWDLPDLSVSQRWDVIVTQYNDKQVTFRKDKLIALSGVSRLFAARFGTKYLAGMWEEDLIIHLTWLTMEPSGDNVNCSIPSWSWATGDTRVINIILTDFGASNVHHPLVSLLEATTDVVDDIFGEIRGATLRIKCSLPLMISVAKMYNRYGFGLQMSHLSSTICLLLFPDRTGYSVGQELYLLPLIEGKTSAAVKTLSGLIIEPLGTGTYRRTGLFGSMPDGDGVPELLEGQMRATYEDKFFVGEALGLDDKGQKMCILNLI